MYSRHTKQEYDFETASYAGGIKEIDSDTTYEQLNEIRKTYPFCTKYYMFNTQEFDREVIRNLKSWIFKKKISNKELLEILSEYITKHKKIKYEEYNSDDKLFFKNKIQMEISKDSILENFNYYLDLGYCFVKIYIDKGDIEVYIRK